MLHQHIVRSFIALFIATLLLCGIVSYVAIQNDNMEHYQSRLESHIQILVRELPEMDDLNAFAKRFKEATQIRFTLIDAKGAVVADSDHDKETMDNHLHREEILKSEKTPFGTSSRFSDTLGSTLLYVAHRFSMHDQTYFLRLAINIDTIMHNFYALWTKLTLIFGSALLAGLYGAYLFSKKIRQEIDKIVENLQQIADKEYRITISSHFSLEFF
ncbi:MAG: hypothetical protein RBR12_12370, partial [Sulfurospirillum cavolei]|nr:hypothetical protein [Sulfurospirillum cavolei]